MKWVWQHEKWPDFHYNSKYLMDLEKEFIRLSGYMFGVYKHLSTKAQESFKVNLICEDAMNTANIEGELLDHESLQSSIRKHFEISPSGYNYKKLPKEEGITKMMRDFFQTFNKKLTHSMLYRWQSQLLGYQDNFPTGKYRKGPMQIISGRVDRPKIHFEVPPASRVKKEMDQFIHWFNTSSKNIPPLILAGITHIYFECIHPFEDGNGRIGRLLSQKVLAQSLGQPVLIALSVIINKNKKKYYSKLEKASQNLDITEWLSYFSEVILEGLRFISSYIEFLIKKRHLLQQASGLNERQNKYLKVIFEKGPDECGEFGISSYIKITKATRATATRDINNLIEVGILTKRGERKFTRYKLNL